MVPFFCIHISQGSVATCLKRGGIFKHKFVSNLLRSRLVKIFENRIIVSEVMAKSLVSCFFDSRCTFPGLSCGVVYVILCLAVLVEFRLVTDRQTDTCPWLVPRMHSIAQ